MDSVGKLAKVTPSIPAGMFAIFNMCGGNCINGKANGFTAVGGEAAGACGAGVFSFYNMRLYNDNNNKNNIKKNKNCDYLAQPLQHQATH